MINPARTLVSWFRPPARLAQSELASAALQNQYHRTTVADLLTKSERHRAELLDWANHLDGKLLAVITADGVYAALLVSLRDQIPGPALVAIGAVAVVSLTLAYLAWRPHTYETVPLDPFLPGKMNLHPDDLRRVLVIAHSVANRNIASLNTWKAKQLASAARLFAASALVTIYYSVIGGIV